MKLAESVTFGGSGLDRAAELRSQPEALAGLRAGACVLPIWRGKPLLDAESRAPVFLAADHAVFAHEGPEVFLGRDEGAARFACDISAWEPQGDTDSVGQFTDPSEQRHPELPSGQVFGELRGSMVRLTPRAAEMAATAKAILEWHRSHRFCARCGGESVVSQAGWQRDCPACGGHHFPRTDPVVIMLITEGNSVLMGRSHVWPEGMYSLLAGFVEPGECIEAAVRREVFEESGVRVGRVDYLASQPWPFPNSLMFGCHGHATSRDITVDPAEIEDAQWVTREAMVEALAGNDPRLKPARPGSIARFLIENWLADTLD
ncbi:NAD(+) diphosphatase [Silicimonas algicola]|uniref:NAD(+) diphosphatase n=1 Tax=Silicimonas algicola TaxID=1826607 RepID=A0A316GH89_9RHOB|nr:NAD(+) diphosphatase [Silicimonas algicola]AZQ68990.1 NAD(+) diphosphatase [Silicimonas algicola]PWK54127.1 NAD+ diphosphatase [Silicimonas algicola]